MFGLKYRLLDSKAWLTYLRRRWADINNKYFKIYDIDKTITHESYATRGFEYIQPTIHEGAARHTEGQLDRIEENKRIVRENLDFIQKNPLEIIKSLSQNKAVFSKIDLAKELDSFINEIALRDIKEPELIEAIKQEILAKFDDLFLSITTSDQLIKICDNDLQDRAIYTTKKQQELEEHFLSNLDYLASRDTHKLGIEKVITPEPSIIERAMAILTNKKHITLSNEQRNAIVSIVNGADISLLIGRPGTGKSTVMKALVNEYHMQGYNVYGASYSAVATLNLAETAHIKAYTLSKWQYDWNQAEALEANGEVPQKLLPKLTSKDIFIIDEMSMIDLKMMDYFIEKVRQAGSKVIFVGDDNQFSAVGLAGASDKLVERLDNVVLNEIFRQNHEVDRNITSRLADFRVDQAIIELTALGRFTIRNNQTLARQELIDDFIQLVNSPDKTDHSIVMIAYCNDAVASLNIEMRARLLATGVLHTKAHEPEGREFYNYKGGIKLALGDRLVFTKNDKRFGLINGLIGRVIRIRDNETFDVELSGIGERKEVTINTAKYSSFDYGYAITAYKAQGKTYDHTLVLIDEQVGYESFNVIATRHRDSSQFYVDGQVLNKAINRKFDIGVDHEKPDAVNFTNQQAALFELLVRREPGVLAHDYIGYDDKHEVKTLKSYLQARDTTSENYKELLIWFNEEKRKGEQSKYWNQDRIDNAIEKYKKGNKGAISDEKTKEITLQEGLKIFDNRELWTEFSNTRGERNGLALEIIEDYKNFRKYISSTSINYGTLLKHAGKSEIQINYGHKNHNPDQLTDIVSSFDKLVILHKGLIENFSKPEAKAMIVEAENITSINEIHKMQISAMHSNIEDNEDAKWQLTSTKQAKEFYHEDLLQFLKITYKQKPSIVMAKWDSLIKENGPEEAFAIVEKDPECLGTLVGIGFGKALSITDKRAVAVYNLNTLALRFKVFEESKLDIIELTNELNSLDSKSQTLHKQYSEISSHTGLTIKQELYLAEIYEHQNHIEKWVKTTDSLKFAGLYEPDQSLGLTQDIQGKTLHSENQPIKEKQSAIIDAKVQTKVFVNDLTSQEVHNKLCDNLIDVVRSLMPHLSSKKIEISSTSIKCGSISIVASGQEKGLWTRYSSGQSGNLFGFIKEAKGFANLKEAVEWGKSYLGVASHHALTTNHLVPSTPAIHKANEPSKNVDYKVLMPVPLAAEKFSPEKTFYYMLKDNKNKLEGLYEYRNVTDELCGYVVRLRDTSTNNKTTLPVVYIEDTNGRMHWKSKGFGENRCLYNEHLLKDSNKPVLIVEGEKTADAASKLYPEFDVVSWVGGSNGYSKTSWQPLKDKTVVIWPDNDQPGFKAADGIKQSLETTAKSCTIVDLGQLECSLPNKWDLADQLPESHSYKVTALLYKSAGISSTDRILEEYVLDHTKENYLKLQKTKFDSFSDYLEAKYKLDNKLKQEKILVLDHLSNKDLMLDSTSWVHISINARKSLDSLSDIASGFKPIESLPHDIYKVLLDHDRIGNKHIVKAVADNSVDLAKSLIEKHNAYSQEEHHISQNLVPQFALSLAHKITEHGHFDNNDHHALMQAMSKTFTKQIQNEMINFTHHQQIMQIQQVKQAQMDM